MLSRVLLKVSAALLVVWLVVLAGVLNQRGDSDAVRAFLLSDCAMPCWQGIRLGSSTLHEAVNVLNAHPWVVNISVDPNRADMEALIGWSWNGQQPKIIGPPILGGLAEVRRGQVQIIRMVTTIPFGEIWLALGKPDTGSVRPSQAFNREMDVHLAIYQDEGMIVRSLLPRPRRLWALWHAPVEIVFQANPLNDSPYRLPCWFCG